MMDIASLHPSYVLTTEKARLRTGRLNAAIRNTHASYSRPRAVVKKMLKRTA
jgi:hypothetical protein